MSSGIADQRRESLGTAWWICSPGKTRRETMREKMKVCDVLNPLAEVTVVGVLGS